jgi:transposase InsO family protein
LSHPYTATSVARLFTDHVFKLHGIPKIIVSDRDPAFTSQFWKELFKVIGIDLLMSFAYHPQTVGQNEVMNKGLKGYLWSFTGDRPRDWVRWLSLADWALYTPPPS